MIWYAQANFHHVNVSITPDFSISLSHSHSHVHKNTDNPHPTYTLLCCSKTTRKYAGVLWFVCLCALAYHLCNAVWSRKYSFKYKIMYYEIFVLKKIWKTCMKYTSDIFSSELFEHGCHGCVHVLSGCHAVPSISSVYVHVLVYHTFIKYRPGSGTMAMQQNICDVSGRQKLPNKIKGTTNCFHINIKYACIILYVRICVCMCIMTHKVCSVFFSRGQRDLI